ncbi:superoxide dismutase family protein [Ekhidna sp.]|uniref:superoxide dismutase family protein n=1 Tax=Ekhidna sp. TaxID=2608089 RepID=UPI003B50A5FE
MKLSSILLILILTFISCTSDDPTPEPGPLVLANATIFWVDSPDGETYESGEQMGFATFAYQDGITTFELRVNGMEPNTAHAMHLHMGTLEEPGRHWNQGKFVAFCEAESMGRLWLKPFAGDVGNIQVDEEGNGEFELQTDLWSVGTQDESDILGTILFIHHKSQDFADECDPGHKHEPGAHTNAKIAGGTVTIAPTIWVH